MNRTLDMATLVLLCRPGVQQRHTAVPGQCVHLVPVELPHSAVRQILNHEARHIHRVLCGGIGRRIGKVQVLQIQGSQARPDSGCQHVDAFVHAFAAHNLCP